MAESRVNFQRRPSNMTPDGYQLQFSDDYGQNEAMISTGELAKPTTSMTILPEELVSLIIYFATLTPEETSGSFIPAYNASAWSLSSKTKRAVILVCQSWRRIATEYLYHAVRIIRLPQLYLLAETLKPNDSQTTHDAVHPQNLGRWIKFLFIQAGVGEHYSQPLQTILKQSPNLLSYHEAVITDATDSVRYPFQYGQRFNYPASTIQHLTLSFPLDAIHLPLISSACPNISSLSFAFHPDIQPPTQAYDAELFPCLSHLTLSLAGIHWAWETACWDVLAAWELPQLSSFTIFFRFGVYYIVEPVDLHNQFFQRHGAKISSLAIEGELFNTTLLNPSPIPSEVFPNLRQFALAAPQNLSCQFFTQPLPSLAQVTFSDWFLGRLRAEHVAFFETILTRKHYPSLQKVVCNAAHWDKYLITSAHLPLKLKCDQLRMWTSLDLLLEIRGIRLEDTFGRSSMEMIGHLLE